MTRSTARSARMEDLKRYVLEIDAEIADRLQRPAAMALQDLSYLLVDRRRVAQTPADEGRSLVCDELKKQFAEIASCVFTSRNMPASPFGICLLFAADPDSTTCLAASTLKSQKLLIKQGHLHEMFCLRVILEFITFGLR